MRCPEGIGDVGIGQSGKSGDNLRVRLLILAHLLRTILIGVHPDVVKKYLLARMQCFDSLEYLVPADVGDESDGLP